MRGPQTRKPAEGADPPGLRDLALPRGSDRAVIFKMETNPAPPPALGPLGKGLRPRRPPGPSRGGSCGLALRALSLLASSLPTRFSSQLAGNPERQGGSRRSLPRGSSLTRAAAHPSPGSDDSRPVLLVSRRASRRRREDGGGGSPGTELHGAQRC